MDSKEKYTYDYPHPALTVDAVVYTFSGNELKTLLVQRKDEPFRNKWVFPGGFVNENETVEKAIVRELMEETALCCNNLEQLYTASAPGRDPRGWTVSTVFVGFVNWDSAAIAAGDDAKKAEWIPLHASPPLAFDHRALFIRGKEYFKRLIRFSIMPAELFPTVFLLEQIHALYFQLTGSKEESEVLVQRLIDVRVIEPHTYSNLFTFNSEKHAHITQHGFAFV